MQKLRCRHGSLEFEGIPMPVLRESFTVSPVGQEQRVAA